MIQRVEMTEVEGATHFTLDPCPTCGHRSVPVIKERPPSLVCANLHELPAEGLSLGLTYGDWEGFFEVEFESPLHNGSKTIKLVPTVQIAKYIFEGIA